MQKEQPRHIQRQTERSAESGERRFCLSVAGPKRRLLCCAGSECVQTAVNRTDDKMVAYVVASRDMCFRSDWRHALARRWSRRAVIIDDSGIQSKHTRITHSMLSVPWSSFISHAGFQYRRRECSIPHAERSGKKLAKEAFVDADMVIRCAEFIPVSRPAAMPRKAAIPYEMGLVKKPVHRQTFIQPTQELREKRRR